MTSEETPLERAVGLARGQAPLAREATKHALNGARLTQAMIWKWLNQARGPVPPAEWVIPIERALGGRITRHELRPDIYPVEEEAA